MKKIDFHSHVIPHIDDGAKNTATAIKILSESFNQGVDMIIATPHFKDKENEVDGFISKREIMLRRLKAKVSEQSVKIPEIALGAEVAVFSGLSDFTNLRALCIENTDYILLEMPYTYWFDSIFDEVYKIILKRGLTPVIAHVERYLGKEVDWDQFDKLFSMGVILQFNAPSFCSLHYRKQIRQILKKSAGLPFVLGSDCHDLGSRKTHFYKACQKIKKHFGNDFLDDIFLTSEKILNNEKIEIL